MKNKDVDGLRYVVHNVVVAMISFIVHSFCMSRINDVSPIKSESCNFVLNENWKGGCHGQIVAHGIFKSF